LPWVLYYRYCYCIYVRGPKGHAAVATIAQALINSNVQSNLQQLLPDSNGEMPPIASWADDIRGNPLYDWSHPLHFINTPAWFINNLISLSFP
jgi:hypothetical protein